MNACEEINKGRTKSSVRVYFEWKITSHYQPNVLPVTRGTKTKRLDIMHQTQSKLKFLVNAREKTCGIHKPFWNDPAAILILFVPDYISSYH